MHCCAWANVSHSMHNRTKCCPTPQWFINRIFLIVSIVDYLLLSDDLELSPPRWDVNVNAVLIVGEKGTSHVHTWISIFDHTAAWWWAFSASRALPWLKYRLAPWVWSWMYLDMFLPLSSLFVLWCVSCSSVELAVLHSISALASLTDCQQGSCHIIVRKNLSQRNIWSYWKAMSVRRVDLKDLRNLLQRKITDVN